MDIFWNSPFRVSSCELLIKTEFQVISWHSSYIFVSGVCVMSLILALTALHNK